MLMKEYAAIDAIVSNRRVQFPYITVELFDLIFQKTKNKQHQRRLFVYALMRLNDSLDSLQADEKKSHLFTGILLDPKQDLEPIEAEDQAMLYGTLISIKGRFRNNPLRAIVWLYRFFRTCVPEELYYQTFCKTLESGFLPLRQRHIAYVYGRNDERRVSEIVHQMKLMEWMCGHNEIGLVAFALNLVNEHRKFPVVQFEILLMLASQMKGRGFENGYGLNFKQQRDEGHPILTWPSRKETARGSTN